ncbi:MAG: hypothetical protein AAB262_08860 [Elusimicrobiota bacterium]
MSLMARCSTTGPSGRRPSPRVGTVEGIVQQGAEDGADEAEASGPDGHQRDVLGAAQGEGGEEGERDEQAQRPAEQAADRVAAQAQAAADVHPDARAHQGDRHDLDEGDHQRHRHGQPHPQTFQGTLEKSLRGGRGRRTWGARPGVGVEIHDARLGPDLIAFEDEAQALAADVEPSRHRVGRGLASFHRSGH